MQCRICVLPEPHVHPSEESTALLCQPPADFNFKPERITGLCFAPAAIKQDGVWWAVSEELVTMVWPVFRKRRARSAFRPPEQEDERDEEDDER